LRLSIFLNSPVCDNSPTSCSGNHLRFVTSLFWFWHTSDGLRVKIWKICFWFISNRENLLPFNVTLPHQVLLVWAC
jgi:hypothetical protein